jgi:Rrf2 family iron-sulfur cluster assembly transcriptional regulator
MRVTTWAEYSLIICINLARRRRGDEGAVSARELAEAESLPADYVEQILLRLRRGGLVESLRGAKGGYLLARDPEAISVRDVIQAAEHHTFEVRCENHPLDAERCAPGHQCSIRPIWEGLARRIDEFLTSVSLADLLQDEHAVRDLVSIQVTT